MEDGASYHAFFSNNKSTDIVLKTVFTVFLFTSIVFCISWLNSLRLRSRSHRNVQSFDISDFSSLFLPGSINKFSPLCNHDIEYVTVSFRLNTRFVTIISQWSRIEELRNNVKLRTCFSKCPSSFSSTWKGLLFSDPFTTDYQRLNYFVEFASQTIPPNVFISASSRAVEAFLSTAPKEITFASTNVNQLIFHTLFQAFIYSFTKPTYLDVLGKLSDLSSGVFHLYTFGRLPEHYHIDVRMVARAVDRLVEPFIFFELDRGSKIKPGTFLSCLLLAKQTFSSPLLEDVESFLTTKHLNHILFEFFFLGHHSLVPCLRTLLAALDSRPGWSKRMYRELSEHQRFCPYMCRNHKTSLNEKCLDVETECLPFTKALCLETLRFTVAGWPFGCLREAFRDGEEFLAGDLVLLNEPAVFHDSILWFKELQAPGDGKPFHRVFAPTGRQGTTISNYLASRVLLGSKVCFLRRIFLYHLLFGTVVNLFLRCSVKQTQEDEAEEFLDLPLFLPLDSSFMQHAILQQRDPNTS